MRDLVSRKHDELLEDAVARANGLRECSSGRYSKSWRRPGLTNARATRAKWWQSLAYGPKLSKWLRWLWLCRGPRKDRRMMSLAGRCAGQQIPRLALMSGLMSWAGKAGALETTGCARVDISLNQTAVCAGACTASTRRSSGASKSARLRRE